MICLQKVSDYRKAIEALTAALGAYDRYMIDRAHYFRASAYFEYARMLARTSDETAVSDALIDSCAANALADLREISPDDPRMVISVKQQIKKIAEMRKSLAGK